MFASPTNANQDTQNKLNILFQQFNLLKNEVEIIKEENKKLKEKVESLETIGTEAKTLKKDVLFLVQFLHGYGLNPECNKFLKQNMKQTIETWFNNRFKDILPTNEEEEKKDEDDNDETIIRTIQRTPIKETNKLFSPLFGNEEKNIFSQSEPSFVGTDTIPTFVNEIPFPSYEKPPSLHDFPFPVHQVNGGQHDMFKRRQDSTMNTANQFRTYR